MLFFNMDRIIIFQFISNCLIKYLRENFAEKPCDDKNQDNNEYGGCDIKEKAACRNQGDNQAVSSHTPKAYDVFRYKTIVIYHRTKYLSELVNNKKSQNAGRKQEQEKRDVVVGKVAAVSSIELDAEWKGEDNEYP